MNNKMLTVDSAIFKKYEDEIERLQKEIEQLKADKQVLSHYKFMYEQAKQ